MIYISVFVFIVGLTALYLLIRELNNENIENLKRLNEIKREIEKKRQNDIYKMTKDRLRYERNLPKIDIIARWIKQEYERREEDVR